MTYTFKLARRLAILRDCAMLTALLLLAACAGDSTAPETTSTPPFDHLVSLLLAPRSVTIATSQRVQFRAHAGGPKRGPLAIAVTWTASGGTIRPDGTFSSATPGTFKVVGRGRGWKLTDTSVVQVVPDQPDLVRLAVTPDPVALDAGAQRTFTAIGYLPDGSTAPVGVNWSATGGEVDPGGVYTAGSNGGSYRVIAINTAGTLADTAAITINAAAAPVPVASTPTLAGVILSPASVTLVLGGSRQFDAYGRTSTGDSVAVAVAFTATGGSITQNGLYTAGQTTGTYKVIATSTGLADTAIVTLTQALSSGGTLGLPFGASHLVSSVTGTAPLTMSLDGYTAGTILSQLADARTKRLRALMNMTGGSHSNYMTDGVFDMAKWQAAMDTYNTPTIKAAVATAVADGTIIGNSVMDEPNVTGLGDGNTWGPAGTMTKARVDEMCGYVKAIFPTLPVGVSHHHDTFEPTKSYRVCDFLIDQYSWRSGDVVAFRDAGLALGARDHHAILFSMNVLNGGVQDKDGTWDCTSAGQAGLGTYSPNCRMTAQQIHDYGMVLGPAGCGLNMWRYDATFFGNSGNQTAFKAIADALAKLPRKPCTRS